VSKSFKYLSGGHSLAGDGEIGIYDTEGEKSVYIYESYGSTRFHHTKRSIFNLLVKSWEIYVDDKVSNNIKKETYKRVSRRCYRLGKVCKNIKSQVVAIQEKLKLKADGIFGAKTESAVKIFQRKNGLKVDGVVGANT